MIDQLFMGLDPIMNDILGSETVKARRPLRLTHQDGTPATSLKVAAMAILGAASVRLRSVLTGSLGGYIGRGLSLTLSGHIYAVAKDSSRADDGTILINITPGLLAAAAVNDPATIAEVAEWDLPSCLVYSPRQGVVPARMVGSVSFALSVPKMSTMLEPKMDDVVSCSLGTDTVLGFLPSDGGSWEILAGRAGQPAIDAQNRNPVARDWS